MKIIHQVTLQALLRKRQQVEELSKEIEAAEAEILASLKDGAQCQSGIVVAAVKSFERKTVAWKEKFMEFVDEIRGKGEGARMAERVHASTTPKTYESLSIKLVG